VDGKRYLVVTADDYGIGPATSQGILELAALGRVTSAVLLVNSPHAESDVRLWRQAGQPMELGWHPCLTLDAPILPAKKVPTLVGKDGRFPSLGGLLRRLMFRRVRPEEIGAEFQAQLERFHDLVGHAPTVVNTHHHVQVFRPIGAVLRALLGRGRRLPYMRRVREPWTMLARVPGARLKRLVLSWLGRGDARQQRRLGFPGNDWLAGITDPPCVTDANFLARWLTRVPGEVVELTCHPGRPDPTLVGRDCTQGDEQHRRRFRELQLLLQANFDEACRRARFILAAPSQLPLLRNRGRTHAA
jgi:predicted glycoside hydrolase/deacetylase ChbG (UPF0249 family)